MRELLAEAGHGQNVVAAVQDQHRDLRLHNGSRLPLAHPVLPHRVQMALQDSSITVLRSQTEKTSVVCLPPCST